MAPIVTTVFATAIAVLPLLLYGNTPGHEILRPMATVILGGLVTTVLLNLFVMPAVFARFALDTEPDLLLSSLELAPDLDLSRV
jgi:Cu/Ag efflux pump CusA